jgi:hypothetical protein
MNALACHRRFVYRSLLIISVCYLLFQESAPAQHVWGYASLEFDASADKLIGYASVETDYNTAALYNVQLDATIYDQNQNAVAYGSVQGYQTASIIKEVADLQELPAPGPTDN